jgi:hypothetical protein
MADTKLVLVVENKVVETARGKADLSSSDSSDSQTAKQLSSYAHWLKNNHPSAGLVLLGIDEGPRTFLCDRRTYPAAFRFVFHWTQIWRWLKRLPDKGILTQTLCVFVKEFTQFLEERNLSEIDNDDLTSLRRCVPYVDRFLIKTNEKVAKILKRARISARQTLPEYKGRLNQTQLPAGNFAADGYTAIGDYAYCFELRTRWQLMRLKWYVGWGFRVRNQGTRELQAFVMVLNEADGTAIPRPPQVPRLRLENRGWRFVFEDMGHGQIDNSFSVSCDASDFLQEANFDQAYVNWLRVRFEEAAEILEAARHQVVL